MPQLLALEWDAREARVAVGRTGGRDVVVEHAFAVDLASRDAGQPPADAQVGEAIAAALAERNLGRLDTLVAVGRASIELRLVSLPPAPTEELPDMVRFQAMRQFSALGDDWPLDYVPLEQHDEETLNVLAAAISPAMVKQIRATCDAASLEPQRLLLRPFAAASLIRHRAPAEQCRLVIDLLADEADLTVMVGQSAGFIRTVKLPMADAAQLAGALAGEVRRTMAAAQNQLGGQRVERILICGDSEEHAALKTRLADAVSLPVDLINPFEGLKLGRQLRDNPPAHPGRFAPLLGMLVDEAAGGTHAVDFLAPRKRPEPVSNNRRNLLVGATVAVAALAVIFMVWIQFRLLDQQIAGLRSESGRLDERVKAAEELIERQTALDEFTLQDVTWLDELDWLSKNIPSPDDVRVTKLNFTARRGDGGDIDIDAVAANLEAIDETERSLDDGDHSVFSKGSIYDSKNRFPHSFAERISVKPWDAQPPVVSAEGDASEPQPGSAPRQDEDSEGEKEPPPDSNDDVVAQNEGGRPS